MKKGIKLVIGIGLIVFGVLFLIGLIKFGSVFAFWMVYPFIFKKVEEFGINPYLVKAAAVLGTVMFVFVLRYLFSFKRRRRMIGYGLLLILFLAHCLIMFFTTKDRLYGLKYCSRNPITNKLICDYKPGIDDWGNIKHLITSNEIIELRASEMSSGKLANGEIPCAMVVDWFDRISGRPLIYYDKAGNNFYCLVLAGFSPYTRNVLKAVDSAIVTEIRKNLKPVKVDDIKTKVKSESVEISFWIKLQNWLSAVLKFLSNKIIIIIFLTVLNLMLWIGVFVKEEKLDKILNSNLMAGVLLLSICFLNFFLGGRFFSEKVFSSLFESQFLFSMLVVLYYASVLAFVLFCLGWIVGYHQQYSPKINHICRNVNLQGRWYVD